MVQPADARPISFARFARIILFFRLATPFLAVGLAPLVSAATYTGTVISVTGDRAKVAMNGDVMPPVGARAEIFFKMAGSDEEVSVATGSALKIDQGNLLVQIENATGNVETGQLVRFSSSSATTSPGASPAGSATPGQAQSPSVATSSPSPTPTSPEAAAYFAEGITKYDAKDFKSALRAFTKVIELEPSYARGHGCRAATYLSLKQPQRALPDANEAIRLYPEYAAAYSARGSCYAAARKFKQAIQEYDEAIRLDPKNAVMYYNRGTIYGMWGKVKPGIEDLTKAIELNPEYEDAYFNRAQAYKTSGQAQLAKQDLARVKELAAKKR